MGSLILADVASPWTEVTLLASPIIILVETIGFYVYCRFSGTERIGVGRMLALVSIANVVTSVIGSFYVPNLYVYLVRNLIAIGVALVGSTLIEGLIYFGAFRQLGIGHSLAIAGIGNLATHVMIFLSWSLPFNINEAAFRGDVPRLQLMLRLGVSPTATLPLHSAAFRGNVGAATVLLDAGADINARRDGKTALWTALTQSPHSRIVDMLLDRGAAVDEETWNLIVDRIGATEATLTRAAQASDGDLVRRLTASQVPTPDPKNPCDTVIPKFLGHHDAIKALLAGCFAAGEPSGGPSWGRPDDVFWLTAADAEASDAAAMDLLLIRAASMAHVGTLRALAVSAHVNARDATGLTPLMMAASSDVDAALKTAFLLSNGARVDATDNAGRTALMWTAGSVLQHGPSPVATLLSAGASVSVTDKSGRTALMWAALAGLEGAFYDSPAAVRAAPSVLRMLIEAGAPVNARDSDGRTAIMFAARHNHPNWIDTLLAAGANVNAADAWGRNALMTAVRSSGPVSTLLEAGAAIDAADAYGATALMIAAGTGELALGALLSRGAAVNVQLSSPCYSTACGIVRGEKGDTALHLAAARNSAEAVKLLLAHGADRSAENAAGETALAVALRERRDNVVPLLRDAR